MATTSSCARPHPPVVVQFGVGDTVGLADVRPRTLVGVIMLLLLNLTLSVVVTVAALVTRTGRWRGAGSTTCT